MATRCISILIEFPRGTAHFISMSEWTCRFIEFSKFWTRTTNGFSYYSVYCIINTNIQRYNYIILYGSYDVHLFEKQFSQTMYACTIRHIHSLRNDQLNANANGRICKWTAKRKRLQLTFILFIPKKKILSTLKRARTHNTEKNAQQNSLLFKKFDYIHNCF